MSDEFKRIGNRARKISAKEIVEKPTRSKTTKNDRKRHSLYMSAKLMAEADKKLRKLNRSLPEEIEEIPKADFIEALFRVALENEKKVRDALKL